MTTRELTLPISLLAVVGLTATYLHLKHILAIYRRLSSFQTATADLTVPILHQLITFVTSATAAWLLNLATLLCEYYAAPERLSSLSLVFLVNLAATHLYHRAASTLTWPIRPPTSLAHRRALDVIAVVLATALAAGALWSRSLLLLACTASLIFGLHSLVRFSLAWSAVAVQSRSPSIERWLVCLPLYGYAAIQVLYLAPLFAAAGLDIGVQLYESDVKNILLIGFVCGVVAKVAHWYGVFLFSDRQHKEWHARVSTDHERQVERLRATLASEIATHNRQQADDLRALEAALHGRKVFLSQVAHELGTPVSQIEIKLAELRASREASSSVRSSLAQLESVLVRVSAIIDGAWQYLDSGDTDAFNTTPSRVRISRDTFLRARLPVLIETAYIAVRQTKPKASRDAVSLDAGYRKGLIVDCSPLDIIRVFVNLFKNSFEAFDGTRGRIRVKCTRTKDGGWIEVRFMDDGPGIDPRRRELVFGLGESSKHRAASLRSDQVLPENESLLHGHGLSVCREVLDDHGATIKCVEPEGDDLPGAVFVIRMPAAGGQLVP